MKNHVLKKWTFVALTVAALQWAPRPASAQETEAASISKVSAIQLPSGAVRILPASVPQEISAALKKLIVAGGAGVKQGRSEVLAWASDDFKKSQIEPVKAAVGSKLKAAGWTYEEGARDAELAPFTLVTAVRKIPTRKALIGFWAPSDDALVLAWTEMVPAGAPSTSSPQTSAARPSTSPSAAASTTAATTFDLEPTKRFVNVMKAATPPKPTFPKLAVKPGIVRGYVKDAKGNPLQGAVIGIRSTSAGGFYSGASAKSDANGYYEIKAPWGVGSYYCAGYTVDWGEGRAALGLHPADGEADQFATANGVVENWVLWPYGIADRDGASENPSYSGNYYGGTFSVGYWAADPRFDDGRNLPVGAEIEVTLTPDGPLFDGSKGRSFVFHRKVEESAISFYVNNVPLGTYKMSAKMTVDGQESPLKIKETGPYANNPFGLEPKEAMGQTKLTFRPGGAKAGMATAAHGNWNSLDITLYRQ